MSEKITTVRTALERARSIARVPYAEDGPDLEEGSMAEHRIGEVYRRALAAFKSREGGQARAVPHALNVIEMASWRAARVGHALLDSISMMEGSEIDVDILDMTELEDRVVGLVTAKVRVDDLEFTFRTAEVARLIDGTVAERRTLPEGSLTVVDSSIQPA